MKVTDACRAREISPLGVSTPLLVPSFSSRGFPNLSAIYDYLRLEVPEASLVSAYDIHHGFLDPDDIYSSEVVIVDSGGYEARPVHDPNQAYVDVRQGQRWCPEDYRRVLNNLKPLSQLVVVSFDHGEPLSLEEQVGSAQDLFSGYTRLASDFLCKPESQDGIYVDVEGLVAEIEVIVGTFSILGVTEEELGASMLERCRNLLTVRSALSTIGSEMPIHVFGCLDPTSVVTYFLCGADVFDGLSWLRFAYSGPGGLVLHAATEAMIRGEWEFPDDEVRAGRWIRNLDALRSLTKAMSDYATDRSTKGLETQDYFAQVMRLVSAAGLDMEGGDPDEW